MKIKLKGTQRRLLGGGITFEEEPKEKQVQPTELSKASVSAIPVGLGKPHIVPPQPLVNDTSITVSSGSQPNVNLMKPKFKKYTEEKKKKVTLKM